MENEINKDGILKNKKFFYISLIFFIITIAMNFPFPHTNPYGDPSISIFNIPIKTVNGYLYIGIFILLLFFIGLYFLVKSLRKYRGRIVLLAIILTSILPSVLTNVYQRTIATGIYAISYEGDMSKCNFETINPNTLRGTCELIFENHSNIDVPFEITFYDEYRFEETNPMISLMNNGAPYKVLLKGREKKAIKIETDISKKKTTIENGNASSVNIIIRQGEKQRNL